MGLDLDLFEEPVPSELQCGVCRKVLVHPVHSACSHLFCHACLTRALRTEKGGTCPACHSVLKATSHQPSPSIKRQLLALQIHCTHGCGKVCTLAQLPDHVAEDCPNAPVTCPHVQRGCGMRVKRVELSEHVEECQYRHVVCEACGQRTIFIDLFTHQSRKRCLEKKLRQQLIKALRITNTEVQQHRRSLERQHTRLEQQQQRVIKHRRQSTTLSKAPHLSNTTLSNTGLNNSGGDSSNGSECDTMVGTESSNLRPADVFMTSGKATDDVTLGRTGSEREVSGKAVLERDVRERDVREREVREREVSERAVALNTPSPSRTEGTVTLCRHCGKMFREQLNAANSCRWHAGPIIELFGGTCYSCGRLDYQKGCMMGYHEL